MCDELGSGIPWSKLRPRDYMRRLQLPEVLEQKGVRMDMKRLAMGTLAGGITMFVVGYLIWTVAFAGFFAANAGSATGVDRDAPIWWAAVLGVLSLAALVTLAIGWSGESSIGGGFKIGATVGFLVWFGVDFVHYAYFNLSNLTATIADPALEIVRTGVGGAVIGAVLGKMTETDS